MARIKRVHGKLFSQLAQDRGCADGPLRTEFLSIFTAVYEDTLQPEVVDDKITVKVTRQVVCGTVFRCKSMDPERSGAPIALEQRSRPDPKTALQLLSCVHALLSSKMSAGANRANSWSPMNLAVFGSQCEW